MKQLAMLVIVLGLLAACGDTSVPSAPTVPPTEPKPPSPSVFASPSMTEAAGPTAPPPMTLSTGPIDPAPLAPRIRPSVAWTGRELFVWGGVEPSIEESRSFADGAAYAPDTKSWRALPESPLSPRTGTTAVWTGSEVIIWGGYGAAGLLADGAAYDPVADVWRTIAAAPLSPRSGAASAWTGSELVVFGGNTLVGDEAPAHDGAVYDPATDTWRLLPPPPIPDAWSHHLVWTGSEAVLFADPVIEGGPPIHVAAWDRASDTWRVPPRPPVGLGNVAEPPIWTGDRVLTIAAHTFESQHDAGTDPSTVPAPAGAYDPSTGNWSPAPYPPYELAYSAPVVWTGREAWLPGDDWRQVAAYDPATMTWRSIPLDAGRPRFDPDAVWAGDALIVWGGTMEGPRSCEGDDCAPRFAPMDGFILAP